MREARSIVAALVVSITALEPGASRATAADTDKQWVETALDRRFAVYEAAARDIWGYAEIGFHEDKSTARLQALLREAGFTLEAGVSGMPTAFVASYGQGAPVLGLLAEFDALPSLSQDAVPERKAVTDGTPGHACGHHLLGTAAVAAAIALKAWLETTKTAGTVKVFGTPAEEFGAAKVYMVRDGLFKGVDAVLHWHPGSRNDASPASSLAIKQTTFRFQGTASHAAASPDRGRSALDGLEAMNFMVNLMREHVPQETRIHYVIREGGKAANVVPDYAESELMVRHPDARVVEEIWKRIVKAAEGAASGTGTTMWYELDSAAFNLLPNETLARLVYDNLKTVGGVSYTPAEMDFAKRVQASFEYKAPPIGSAGEVQPYTTGHVSSGSTDVGDITWVVPTAGLATAAWVPGVAGHSWQAVASGGTSIGFKGMQNAAKVLAMTGVDLFRKPALLEGAKKELRERLGLDYQYQPMIGDRKPPLDLRQR